MMVRSAAMIADMIGVGRKDAQRERLNKDERRPCHISIPLSKSSYSQSLLPIFLVASQKFVLETGIHSRRKRANPQCQKRLELVVEVGVDGHDGLESWGRKNRVSKVFPVVIVAK